MAERPSTVEAWLQQAWAAVELSGCADTASEFRGDLERAVEAFDQVLALDPAHAEALRAKAIALAQLDATEAAADALVAATRVLPNDSLLQLTAGQTHAKLGQHAAALDAFEAALRLDPSDADARLGRALALMELGRHEEALAAWDAFLRELPATRVLRRNGFSLGGFNSDLDRSRAQGYRAISLATLGRTDAGGAQPAKRTFRVTGYDAFAREDYVVGEFATRSEAEAAVKRSEARAEAAQDPSLRDRYWIT